MNEATGNHDRNGYIIYSWWNKVELTSNSNHVFILNKMQNKRELTYSFIDVINTENGDNGYSRAWGLKMLEKNEVLCVIEEQQVVAWLFLYINNKTKVAYCKRLYVKKDSRRKGCAQILLRSAMFLCKCRNLKELTLYCDNPIVEHLCKNNKFVFVRKENFETYDNKEYSLLKLILQ